MIRTFLLTIICYDLKVSSEKPIITPPVTSSKSPASPPQLETSENRNPTLSIIDLLDDSTSMDDELKEVSKEITNKREEPETVNVSTQIRVETATIAQDEDDKESYDDTALR